MPKYNVHLYTLYREKFVGIEAPDKVAAARIALDMPRDEATEIADAEDLTESVLIDEIEQEAGEDVIVNAGGDGEVLDIIPANPEHLIVPSHGDRRLNDRQTAAVLAGLGLLQQHIFIDGTNNLPPEIDDVFQSGGTVDALNPVEIDELCLRLNVEAR